MKKNMKRRWKLFEQRNFGFTNVPWHSTLTRAAPVGIWMVSLRSRSIGWCAIYILNCIESLFDLTLKLKFAFLWKPPKRSRNGTREIASPPTHSDLIGAAAWETVSSIRRVISRQKHRWLRVCLNWQIIKIIQPRNQEPIEKSIRVENCVVILMEFL